MSGIIEELKARLRVEHIIGSRYGGIVQIGRECCTAEHDSLKVDIEEQRWCWFSHPEADGSPHGGDVLSFLAFERFGISKWSNLDREQRREVIQEAKALAGHLPPAVPTSPVRSPGRPKARKKGRFFSTAPEAESYLEWIHEKDAGKLNASWNYEARDKKGRYIPAIEILRFDIPAKGPKPARKVYQPIHRVRNGWRIGLGPWGRVDDAGKIARPCPLYRLREIEESLAAGVAGKVLHLAEGEKCADALSALGLLATTSQGGSSRPLETDWSPVARWLAAGGLVVIWPDQDKAGAQYAETVAKLVEKELQDKAPVAISTPTAASRPAAGPSPKRHDEPPAGIESQA